MDAHELHRRRDDLQVVDVREADEWAAGHLPGSVNIPMGELTQRVSELDAHHPVVVVCETGSRSVQAAHTLRQAGFAADPLEGGLRAWQGHGGELSDAHGHTAHADAANPHAHDADFDSVLGLMGQLEHEIEQQFGDREPSEAELHQFLRQRLRAEGRPDEEIEEIMNELSD
jgi:rhodanese-related sulfurtransferase/uncharacterized protein YdcH (DUF465 family)